jgi:hypothetical protein
MLHPALTQALATAHIEDQRRAAARWASIRQARRVARASRARGTPNAENGGPTRRWYETSVDRP